MESETNSRVQEIIGMASERLSLSILELKTKDASEEQQVGTDCFSSAQVRHGIMFR